MLRERWQQLKLKLQKNHEAQVGTLREREGLIQRLELEREARRQKREQEEQRLATPMQEVSIPVGAASQFKRNVVPFNYGRQEQHCGLHVDCRLSGAKNRWRRGRTMGRLIRSRRTS